MAKHKTPSLDSLETPKRLHAGMRVLVLTDDEGPIAGTVFEGNQVDLDRRSKSLVHPWPRDDAFGRSKRVEVSPSICRLVPAEVCATCGQLRPSSERERA